MDINFVHLRVQSSFSFLESTLTIDDIIRLTCKNQMTSICLTDRYNLFGALEFSLKASKSNIQAINGAILNVNFNDNITSELLFVVKNQLGYTNLIKLIISSYDKDNSKFFPYINYNDLVQYNEGLIILSSYTDGIIGKYLINKNYRCSFDWAIKLKKLLGNRFYFEIMRHHILNERFIERDYIKIAIDLDIPLVATNQVLFSDISMHDVHDILLCINDGVTREVDQRRKFNSEYYFKSSKEMLYLFNDLPNAILNTVFLSQRCCFASKTYPPMLPSISSNNINQNDLIRRDAKSGLFLRLNNKFKFEDISVNLRKNVTDRYLDRLNYELDIICKMDFAGYFLIVSDFIKWSKQNGIIVGPGRGSGPGSLVAWSLLITDLDPLQFGLLFERFLNPERISMPDFDIDFCQERRSEVINYVQSKYGYNKVGQIITFGTMQAKAVIKDVSRVLGLSYKYAEYLTGLIPFNAITSVTLKQAIKEVKELCFAYEGKGLYTLYGEEELIKQVLDVSLILEGLNRHASTHAAGIVIANKDLSEIVPVYRDKNSDMLIVQYSMKYAEMSGLIKFDFLGLQTLTVINKCIELLKTENINIDFNNDIFKDQKTYQLLCNGKTIGVFQFESVGMQNALRQLKPDSIQDIIALSALYRPGPMDNIKTYISCKHKIHKPDYLHPILEPILKETYGVVIYQEQVLEIAKVFANYTLGNADLLRRAMGKKIKSEMEEQEKSFIEGAIKNNISMLQAKSVFATVSKFAGYGFNKAHASAYAVISYQTAYLKANFLIEFLVVYLNLEINNHDKINLFIQEAKDNNISIIAPNINLSSSNFKIQYNEVKSIVYGLSAIKGITSIFSKKIEDIRSSGGDFKSIIDFIQRLPLKSINHKLLENLIKSGVFDALHINRHQLILSISNLLIYAYKYHHGKLSNQLRFIDIKSSNNEILFDIALCNKNDSDLSIFYEFEVLGLFITTHPLYKYRKLLSRFNIINYFFFKKNNIKNFTSIRIAGVIQKKTYRMSERGRFIILQLSDQLSIFEINIYNEKILKSSVHLFKVPSIVVVDCRVLKYNNNIKLIGENFFTIEQIVLQKMPIIELYICNINELNLVINTLKDCINRNNKILDDNSYIFKDLNICKFRLILLLKINDIESFVVKVSLSESFYLNSEDFLILNDFIL